MGAFHLVKIFGNFDSVENGKRPGGVLGISSDGDDRRILGGLKF